jgi:autotransporter-associated beta strand protein
MKSKYSLVRVRATRRFVFPAIVSAAFLMACFAPKAQAQILTWNGTALTNLANGAWGTAANWTGSNVPDTSAEIASLSRDWLGTTTNTPSFSLGANRTVNALVFEDTGASGDRTGLINTGSILTLAGTNPFVQCNNSLTLNCGLAWGSTAWTKNGGGTLVLNGTNTGSGTINMDAGIIDCGAAEALGTSTPTWTSGDSGRVRFSGGKTYANSYLINPGVTGAVGFGLLGHTGGGGVATITGSITFNGLPGAGGAIMGSNTVGQELRLEGPLNGTAGGYSQRDGRVIYAGGGALAGTANHTNVAIIGANNGYPQGLSPVLGASGNATFDLNGFNQAIAGLSFGFGGQAHVGTVTLGASTLTINGNLTTNGTTPAHVVNATSGGTLAFGATPRVLTINDSTALNDLTINNALITGAGITKEGTGHLLLNGVTSAPAFTLNAGSVTLGASAANTLTVPSLTLASGTNLNLDVAAAGDLINGGTVTSSGGNLVLTQFGAPLTNGIYPLITYTGTSPGITNFTADTSNMGRAQGTLIDTGSAIAFEVTGNDTVYWDGTIDALWQTGSTGNWKLTSDNTATDYLNGDVLTFPSTPTNPLVEIAGANVTPSKVTFANATGTDYEVYGGFGMTGGMSLTKNLAGSVLLDGTAAHSYTGATTITDGLFSVNQAASGLTATSGVDVASPGILRLYSNNVDFTFSRNLTGNGLVELDGVAGGTAGSRSLQLTGVNTGFSGTLHLKATGDLITNGSFRLSGMNQDRLGTSSVIVDARAQLWTTGTVSNNITLTGYGFQEAGATSAHPLVDVTGADGTTIEIPAGSYPVTDVPVNGGLGALRADNATYTGTITLNGDTKITAYNATGTFSNSITNTNPTDDLVLGGTTVNSIIVTTGDNSGLERIWINGGGTAGTSVLQVGTATSTSGTLGSGNVILYTDASSSSLRFKRADGYTLAANQKIIAAHNGTATNLAKATVLVNTTGSGLSLGGSGVIDLSDGIDGGSFFVATDTIGANLTISAGDRVDVGNMGVSDTASGYSGTVNQTGGDVTIINQLRLSHWGNSTGTYNLTGGTLTLTGASPNNSPSTAASGVANTVGDNNLNGLAVNTILGGGTYIGIDGNGIMNHSGGTFTTNWIVLDNRGDSIAGTNMVDGIDRYNISGTALLKLRSTYGLVARNASTAVSFGGGTIQVDNTGTSGATVTTGADITVPLSAEIQTVASTTTKLDTNGAGNGFTLNRNVTGTGNLELLGDGTVNLDTATLQDVSAGIISNATTTLNKTGAGVTTITGSMANTAGPVTVAEGRLNAPNSLASGSVTVKDGAALFTEATVGNLVLGETVGGKLFIDPNSAGAVTATTLTLNGDNFIELTDSPPNSTITAINYTTKAGTGTLTLANPASFRSAPVVTDTGSQIQITFGAGKALTWSGDIDSFWEVDGVTNWDDSTPADDKFFNNDAVTFADGPANSNISIAGSVSPASINVTAATTAYTINSTAGNEIVGSTGIAKSGAGTLNLLGANLYEGINDFSGGEVVINAAASLGSGVVGNNIALSGGARITHNGAAALNLGANRSIAVGTGGGSLAHSNATAATITLPAPITGNGALNLHSALAGLGTFNVTGDMSGYSGDVLVTSAGTGVTTLNFASGSVPPTAGSITLAKPAAAAAASANNLNLNGTTTLGAGVSISMNAGLNGVSAQVRSGITSNGINAINGTIKVTATDATAINQINSNSGTFTLNGAIVEESSGSAVAGTTLFLRGNTALILNGQVNLPNSNVSRTDGGNLTINSTGNVWANSFMLVGTVTLGVSDGLCVTAPLNLGQNDANGVAFNLNGFNQKIGALSSNPAIVNGFSTNKNIRSNDAPSTLTIESDANATYAGNIISQVSLVKNGTGEQTLLGTNTYTGTTVVNGGALIINGNTSSTAGATVNGGVLGGLGTLAGATTVAAAGTVSPGMNATGVMTFSNGLTLQPGSTYRADITGATASDRVNVSGGLAANGTIQVVLTGYTPVDGDVFDLANGVITGTPTFDFANAVLGSGLEWDTSTFATDGTIKVVSGDTYVNWADGFSLAGGDALKSADPDGDAISNLLEFYLNGNPTVSSQTILPELDASGSNFIFSFTRLDDAVGSITGQKFQYGSDLAGWTDVTVPDAVGVHTMGAVTITITDAGTTDDVEVSVPKGSNEKMFGRLQVTAE